MLALFHAAVARVRAFLHPGKHDLEFDEELESHLAMAEEDKVRQGIPREEARRLARVELGGLTQLREAGREARGLPWLDSTWLDLKLALRMSRKSWGLTLIGGLAMAVVIAIGVAVFAVLDLAFGASLPLDQGDRVVALQTWDETAYRRHRSTLYDLERWSTDLDSVEEVGAFQTVERRLIVGDGPAGAAPAELGEPVRIAEMSASGFALARVAPLLGRTLVEDDEREAADPVAVIGYDVWQSRFSADPAILGQLVRLGEIQHTVVGVMPEGFGFPVNYQYWTPLRSTPSGPSDLLGDEEGEGVVFARLAPGASLERAQAELTALGLLALPEPGKQLLPRVVPYTFAFTGDFKRGDARWVIRLIVFLLVVLLIPPCANIGILVYARTVTRQGEFAARYALGANRRRIVGQLFLEMLVLSAGAACVALFVAQRALSWLESRITAEAPPFWMDFSISLTTVLFAAGLAVVGALIAGVVPALKATGRQLQSGLRSLDGSAGVQLGATWTALVVIQVALTVAALPSAVEMGWGTVRQGILGPGFAAEEYLTAQVVVDQELLSRQGRESEGRPFASHLAALQAELVRQLEAEPGVTGVTVAAGVPRKESWRTIEVEGAGRPDQGLVASSNLVRVNHIDDVFFDVFATPILTGRDFTPADLEPGQLSVVVSQTLAQQLLGEGNPLGQRVRYVRGASSAAANPEPEPWFEIVGVVPDLPANAARGTLYHPLTPGEIHPISLAARIGLDPTQQADRLRELAMALDGAIRLEEVRMLNEIYRDQQVGNNIGASTLVAVTFIVLLLSAAGMYSLLSFTVNQRRKEIGIRSALGAQPRRVLASIFRRAVIQVASGALIGVLVALAIKSYLPIELMGGWKVPGIIPGTAVFMMAIGLLAALGPARRGLRVEPIEELRKS